MTAEELAAAISGREYREELSKEEEAAAKAAGLVVIFGASDDLAELRGAISDEAGCYDGGTLLIDSKGLIPNERDEGWDDDEMEDYLRRKKAAIKVEALWCAPNEPGWTYKTDAPHATFEIMEDGEVYCRGIVLALPDLPEAEG